MALSISFRTASLLVACLTLFMSAPCKAQESVDADTREVNSYELTEEGMEKFALAISNLGPLTGQFGVDCGATAEDDAAESAEASARDSNEAGNDYSLNGQAARISSVPGAAAAIESAGMPVREFVVFIWSMIQNGIASWMLSQPDGQPPAGVTMANVDFYRAHEAELQRLAQLAQTADCQDHGDGAEEEYPEDQDNPGEEHYDGEED